MRRASPIVVAERGWNERSQLKIRILANDLDLPDHLYELAVARLQQGELQFDDQLTAPEQQFVNYLHTHFGRSKMRVLTATHETRAVQIARREYNVPQSRARQLVRQVASDLGISRVGRLEATQHVAELIDDTIGDDTTVSDRLSGRIFAAGTKWGVETGKVEILITNRLQANRQAVDPGNPWPMRITAACLSILVMTLVAWFGYVLFTSPGTDNPEDPASELEDKDAAARSSAVSAIPFWWSEETQLAFETFTANPRTARFPHELLKSTTDSSRLEGYKSVVQLIKETPGVVPQQCTELFACCFADESAGMAGPMAALISPLDDLPADRLPLGPRAYLNQWRANELIEQCAAKNIGPEKLTALDSVSVDLSGTAVSTAGRDFPQHSRRALAARQWDHVNSLGFLNPELAARLFAGVADMSRDLLVQAHPAEFSTAVSLLSVQPDIWTLMRSPLERLIEESDDDQMLELYQVGVRSDLSELQSWLALRMASRLDIDTERRSRTWIDSAIQSRLGMVTTSAGIFEPRRARLVDAASRAGLLDAELQATPQSIADAAHYATIGLLLQHAESTGSTDLLETIDEMLANPPRNLAVRTSQSRSAGNLTVYRRATRRAMPSDIRTRDDALRSLAEADPESEQARAIAFERLGRVAPRFREITQNQATMLARYMLNATETSELVAIEKFCAQMKHWPNLALALADEIRTSDCSIDQAITCAGLITGAQFDPGDGENWRQKLHDAMMERMVEGMRHTAEIMGKDTRYQWNELRLYLISLYRTRCIALGVDGAATSASRSPAELLELLLPVITDGIDGESLQRRLRTNRFLAADPLHLFVLHGQLMSGDAGDRPVAGNLPAMLLGNERALLRLTTGDKP